MPVIYLLLFQVLSACARKSCTSLEVLEVLGKDRQHVQAQTGLAKQIAAKDRQSDQTQADFADDLKKGTQSGLMQARLAEDDLKKDKQSDQALAGLVESSLGKDRQQVQVQAGLTDVVAKDRLSGQAEANLADGDLEKGTQSGNVQAGLAEDVRTKHESTTESQQASTPMVILYMSFIVFTVLMSVAICAAWIGRTHQDAVAPPNEREDPRTKRTPSTQFFFNDTFNDAFNDSQHTGSCEEVPRTNRMDQGKPAPPSECEEGPSARRMPSTTFTFN